MNGILIADSGATKCEWCLLNNGKKKKFITQGISPYFLNEDEIIALLNKELVSKLKQTLIEKIFFYGTGLKNNNNRRFLHSTLKKVFTKAAIEVETDLTGAARALCKNEKGIACILGTGCNSCFYTGKKL